MALEFKMFKTYWYTSVLRAWLVVTLIIISSSLILTQRGLLCYRSVALSFQIALTYVGSLYIWRPIDPQSDKYPARNYDITLKRRFIGVTIASLISPFIVLLNMKLNEKYFGEATIWELLGLRSTGFITAAVFPLLLTMVLFSGPMLTHVLDGVFLLYIDPRFWISSFQNVLWIRNYIMAPLTEEFTFRACMLPVLIPCLGTNYAILLCPLFFGFSHFHHMVEDIKQGTDFLQAFYHRAFQFAFTTVFGIYSAFLFIRTGHFMAPFVVHVFCNHMGFPNFSDLLNYRQPTRILLIIVYISGLILWYYLLYPATQPDLYGNKIYR